MANVFIAFLYTAVYLEGLSMRLSSLVHDDNRSNNRCTADGHKRLKLVLVSASFNKL